MFDIVIMVTNNRLIHLTADLPKLIKRLFNKKNPTPMCLNALSIVYSERYDLSPNPPYARSRYAVFERWKVYRVAKTTASGGE